MDPLLYNRYMRKQDLKLTTLRIYDELENRGIPVEIIDAGTSWLKYYHREKWHFVRSTLTDKESAHSYVIAHNKRTTAIYLRGIGIRHPATFLYDDSIDIQRLLDDHKRLVVKPYDGAHGQGITTGVTTINQCAQAIDFALQYSDKAIIQEHVEGDDYRVLIIDGVFVAAMARSPAAVLGDGTSSIEELVNIENENPDRGDDDTFPLVRISIERAKKLCGDLKRVPSMGETVVVSPVANLSSGGSARDVTDIVPESMRSDAIAIAREFGMGVCGIDFLWSGDHNERPCVIEINATPGINMHDSGRFGEPRGAVTKFVDYLLK